MPSLHSEGQSLNPSPLISLFQLDASSIGGPIEHFVQGRGLDGSEVVFGGVTYTAVDVQFEGLDVSGVGGLPTPRMTLANSDGTWNALLNTYGDLLGCTIKRIRTHERFLDDGSDPDPMAFWGPDVFRFERPAARNPIFIQWELSASIDQQGKKLPGRQVIRDTCLWRYRRFNPVAGAFDYSSATCPYTGSVYYDINDQVVATPADDVPSRRLSCCKARFGEGTSLPFGGFPGAGRART